MSHPQTARNGDEIDITAADWRPGPLAVREAVKSSLEFVARHNSGLVHIGLVRPLLPPWASGPQVGATICTLVRQGTLVPTGAFAESGDTKNRHGSRPVRVYVLSRALTPQGHA